MIIIKLNIDDKANLCLDVPNIAKPRIKNNRLPVKKSKIEL